MADESSAKVDESAPLVLDDALQQMLHDDQEEWEYEYSTTETETYYLALELSYPEFKGTSAKVNSHSRGGYYKNWQDTSGGAEPASRSAARPAGEPQIKEEEDSSNDEAEPAAAEPEEDEDGNVIDPALRSKGKEPIRAIDLTARDEQSATPARHAATPVPPSRDGAARETTTEMRDDIQILELHSDNPLISYRGRLFEGEWAEIIGTEAMLMRHDDKNPLPALRNLAADIDLLGAASSRIVTREKIATARQQNQDPLAATRQLYNIHIPPGKDRTGERRQQARFLENLMALKKLKGQTDEVTVYAMDGEGKDFDDTKDPDYRPRRKRAPNNATSATATPATEGSGSGSGRGRATARGRSARGRLAAARRGGTSRQRAAAMVPPRSTPTPARWEDLEGEGEAMEEDGEEDDDDVSMG